MLVQFSLLDERTRNNKGVLQAISLPKCDVEKSISEIGPPGLIPAAERLMVGIGRGDHQHIADPRRRVQAVADESSSSVPAKPADLPITQPVKFELSHQPQNRESTRPHNSAGSACRADEVIE